MELHRWSIVVRWYSDAIIGYGPEEKNGLIHNSLALSSGWFIQLANVIGKCLDYISERGLLFDSHTSLGKLHDLNDGSSSSSSSSRYRLCHGEIEFCSGLLKMNLMGKPRRV